MRRDTGPFAGYRIKPKGWLSLALGATQLVGAGANAYNSITGGGGGGGGAGGGIADILSALPGLLQYVAPYISGQQMQDVIGRIQGIQTGALDQTQQIARANQAANQQTLAGGQQGAENALWQAGGMSYDQLMQALNNSINTRMGGAQTASGQLQQGVGQAINSRMTGATGAGNQLANYLGAAVPAIQQGYGMGIGALAPYAGAGQNALAALMQGLGLGGGGYGGGQGGAPWQTMMGSNLGATGYPGGQGGYYGGGRSPQYMEFNDRAPPGTWEAGLGGGGDQISAWAAANPALPASYIQGAGVGGFPSAGAVQSYIQYSGKSPQEMIQQLAALGVNPAQADMAMNWAPGTAQQYIGQYGGGQSPAGPAAPRPAAASGITPQQAAAAVQRAIPQTPAATGGANMQSAIQNIVGQGGSAQQIIGSLRGAGVTNPAQVDQAMGWAPGTAAKYQQQYGG